MILLVDEKVPVQNVGLRAKIPFVAGNVNAVAAPLVITAVPPTVTVPPSDALPEPSSNVELVVVTAPPLVKEREFAFPPNPIFHALDALPLPT